jgi:hypothetical protein
LVDEEEGILGIYEMQVAGGEPEGYVPSGFFVVALHFIAFL